MQDVEGTDRGENNGQGCSKSFQDVVCIFYHNSNDDTAQSLETNESIDKSIKYESCCL